MKKFIDTNRVERGFIDLFWVGIVLYMASYTISMSQQVSYIICQAFQSIGLCLSVISVFGLLKFRIANRYLQLFFTLYICWLLSVVFRGIKLDYISIKVMLFDAWFGVIPYLVPFLLLLPKKIYFFKRLFDTIVVLGLFYILYDLLFLKDLMNPDGENLRSQIIVEYFTRTLGVTCFFILLTYKYHSKKRIYLAIFVTVAILFFAVIRARRGTLFGAGLILLFTYFIYLSESNHKLSVVLFSIFCALLFVGASFVLLDISKIGAFEFLLERGLEDTRTKVEICFVNDMKFKDWIIGKGINGEYFCPDIDVSDVTGYRDVIETDYLQHILKGGFISLGLFLFIAVPAMFRGLFKSKNILGKAAGVWIFYALINMYPASVNTFTVQYILVWLCIGICYSDALLKVTDNVLIPLFKKNAI